MIEKTPHEKYLAGEPLNEELAALKEGRSRDFLETTPAWPPSLRLITGGDIERELTRGERMDLKELRQSAGWPVVVRLLEKTSAIHKKGAISSSQTNPLANKDTIAEEWAYCTMFDRAKGEIQALIEAELRQLDEETRR